MKHLPRMRSGPPVTADDLRTCLREGVCPECLRGPWASVLGHMAKAHGTDAFTARAQARIPQDEPLTSPEAHDRLASASRERVAQGFVPPTPTAGRQVRATPLGRAAHRKGVANLVPLSQQPPDVQRAARTRIAQAKRRPHPCVVCGTTIPTAKRKTCGPGCEQAAYRRAGRKAGRGQPARKERVA